MPSHFKPAFIEKQKSLLLKIKEEIINKLQHGKKEDLEYSPDQTVEDGDQAQVYLNQNVSFGLRERDLSRLREIDEALARIDNGTYGICEETDEPIGEKRLEKMPWTRYSIEAAEQIEREAPTAYRAG